MKVLWKAGQEVEVAWTIQVERRGGRLLLQANHGGGYQYRLCPRGQKLDEECFQKMPLAFIGMQSFRWGDGTQVVGVRLLKWK